ncbi:4-(cytidine 5'-diphospho)-2-C-methyl-D-erythritol kinase [Thalassobius sp. MITS945101]|uniref:4-(cytidine 5'-diphospho)-2-C-methyl-D-erythritol kinase n=1 Tax=Thalassobius sp. MITS945101 TaxID=3096994 RepID=UPI003999E022
MQKIEGFAPAKVNLTLHVTGQRQDGYHLLDSLVVFADLGDRLTCRLGETSLAVSGPMGQGVPVGPSNLVLRAAELMEQPATFTLEKHLPAAAGIGGGSSDAAAALRLLAQLTGQEVPDQGLSLGADLPICMLGRAGFMRGIGEDVTPVDLPPLHAVLVNPGVPVPTGAVFDGLVSKDNAPMTALPPNLSATDLVDWLAQQRNDLQAPAVAAQPVIADVLQALQGSGAALARMSGSGATCFGLYPDSKKAAEAASILARPDWWVRSCLLR